MSKLDHQENKLWYVIHTHTRQEGRAESNLIAWNVETFSPRYLSERRQVCRAEPIYTAKPLFPGYIFARFNAQAMSHKIRYTRGVHSILYIGDRPAMVDDGVITLIMSRIGEDGFIKLGNDTHSEGGVVRDGVFSGVEGVFERRMKDSERVMILLKTVTYHFHVVLPDVSVSVGAG